MIIMICTIYLLLHLFFWYTSVANICIAIAHTPESRQPILEEIKSKLYSHTLQQYSAVCIAFVIGRPVSM
jgi:hypothetical protein